MRSNALFVALLVAAGLSAVAAQFKTMPACSLFYVTLQDSDGYDYESDYLSYGCASLNPKLHATIINSLNPVRLKTRGLPSVRVDGMPLAGGTYTASFVPRSTPKFPIWFPARADGNVDLTTDDGIPELDALCKQMVADFLFPWGQYVVGSVSMTPSGSVTTKCSTKWGQQELAKKSPQELYAMARAAIDSGNVTDPRIAAMQAVPAAVPRAPASGPGSRGRRSAGAAAAAAAGGAAPRAP